MCPPNFTLAAVTLGIPMPLFLYKVCDLSWVSWYNALLTQCFSMPSPWENTAFKRKGKTRLRTRFPSCYNPCSQFFVHASDCFVQRNPAVIIMSSTIFTLRTPFQVCLQLMLERILISFFGNVLSIIISCTWQWINCSLVHVLRPMDKKHMVRFLVFWHMSGCRYKNLYQFR